MGLEPSDRSSARVFKPTCPNCSADIPPEDVNISRGTMLCRGCGRVADLMPAGGTGGEEAAATWSPADKPVPKPQRASTRIDDTGGELHLRRRVGSIGTGVFLSFWLCGWTVGCVFITHRALTERGLEWILFAIPFLASWVFVAFLVPYQFFGFESLRIGRDGLRYQWGVFGALGTRDVPLEAVRSIHEFSYVADSDSGRQGRGLRIDTDGRSIRFAKGADEEELEWLSDLLRRWIHDLAPSTVVAHAPAISASTRRSPERRGRTRPSAGNVVEILQPQNLPQEPPADCSLRLERDIRETVFSRRPPLGSSPGSLVGLTFINLFWNGIVSVFVLVLFADFQWFLALFLVPFVAVGLAMFAMWLGCLFLPFSRSRWVFTPGQISTRWTVLGLGRTRYYELLRLQRLELRRKSNTRKWTRKTSEDEYDDRGFCLTLVGHDGQDLVEFGWLTQGEARWMAAELFSDFRQWMVTVGQ